MFAVIAWVLRKLDFPTVPILLGLVLIALALAIIVKSKVTEVKKEKSSGDMSRRK